MVTTNSQNKTLLLFLFLFISVALKAQTLSGRVTDEKGEEIPYVNIALYLMPDSVLAHGTISDMKGEFSLKDIKVGTYVLIVSSIGYDSYTQKLLFSQQTDKKLDTIELRQGGITLNDVVVKAKRNPLKVDKGKFMLSVSNSFLKEQNTTLDVLSFLPGVISSNDQISVIGKGSPLILINNREMHSYTELEMLTPNQIKSVSIDTNPSAKYESKYQSVVHIKTTAALTESVAAQVTHKSTMGRKYSDKEGINLNIAKGKWNNYLFYQLQNDRKKEDATNRYTLYNNNDYSVFSHNQSYNEESTRSANHTILFNSTYQVNAKNDLTVRYSLDLKKDKIKGYSDELTQFSEKNITHTTDQSIKDRDQLHDVELSFGHEGNKEQVLITSIGYIYSRYKHENELTTDNTLLDLLNGGNQYNVLTVKADYAAHAFMGWDFETGGKYVTIQNKGNSSSLRKADGSYAYNDQTRLNDGTLEAYLNINKQLGNVYLEAGARGEYVYSDYNLNENRIYKEKHFTVYPSLRINYTPSKKIAWNLSYNNKSQRPSFNELSPVIQYVNAMLYEQGNPALKLMNSHQLSLGLMLNNKVSVEASYTNNRNRTMYVLQPNANLEGGLINSPINVNATYYRLTSSYSDKFGIYRFAYNGMIQYDVTRLPFMGSDNTSFKPRFYLSTVNQFDIMKGSLVYCNFDISSSYTSLSTKVSPAYGLSIGWMQKFCNNRLTVTLSGNDLLHYSAPRITTSYGKVVFDGKFNPDSRNIGVSIKYTLNNFKKNTHEVTRSQEEIQRIK